MSVVQFSVDFLILILTLFAQIIPPPSLLLDSQSSTWCLAVDLCIWFLQLLDDCSMMTIMVVTNLITGQGVGPDSNSQPAKHLNSNSQPAKC